MTLVEQTRAMLATALELYRDSPRATGWLRRHLARFDEPLRVAVVGPHQSGKSTVVSAIAGDQVAPLEVNGIQVMSWYHAAPVPSATVYPPAAPPWDLPAARSDRQLQIDLEGLAGQQIDRIVVGWPSRSLRDLTLIDSPPVGADNAAHTIESVCMDADAVLYLMRQPGSAELRFLRAVHDHPIARTAPVNCVVVLSRADELGAGRVDALISARQIARRFRREAEVRELCQDVVAVTGLVACAGRTLREPDFAALRALANAPRQEQEACLLSADRFVRHDVPAPIEPAARHALLAGFGLFGIRLATTLIRQGSDSIPTLSAELVRRSGLGDLRESIDRYFTDRGHVLKARAALIALEVVLRMEPRPASATLAAELDRVLAGAHEFRELRLLASLRTGRTALPEELHDEAVRLVGGSGTGVPARLGMADECTDGELQGAMVDALRRWREQAENPMSGAEQRRAASVVVRSCEAMAVP